MRPSTVKEVKHAPTKESSHTSDEIQRVNLADCEFFVGVLKKITEPNAEDFVLAVMDATCSTCDQRHSEAVEVPQSLAPGLRSLVGRQINISNIGGDVRACELRRH
jgi:hypothetical protein